ncbi:uncharacterized protein [Montipora foliosa]|uniref:uncharacterized protein isoform X5 n=1 Tax=Montipora foliosa TaxID=591990 RepID=UPI0035F1BF79
MGPVFYLYGAFLLFGFNVISPCPDGFETIGCFKDTSNRAIQPLEGKDSILDGSYGARKNAIAKCAVAAMRKGYKMFAVQHGGWCAASATADQTFDKYGRSAACGSDGEGGPWANQVYVIKGFETIGCFKDTSNRAIQPLEGKDSILDGSYGARKNAIAKCAVAAMRKGYKMFAVQHGGWCAASATADQTFDKYGRSAACGSDGEGGPWANQVYVIKGFETIGCFKDTSNRAIQPLEGKDSILDGSYGARKNAIAKCAVAAMRKGYKMFAVQHGGWCAASATADQTFDKYGRSAACGSDGEGGPWANQVYVIKGFETIGCFKDTSNRAIQPLEGKDSILDGSYGARKNAIAKCAVAAMRKGYKMFAVQHGGWCAASATADQTFDKYGRSAACGSDGEGGPWANQVYVIKGFETIGCFKDTSNRAIQPLEGKDSILDGSYGARKNAIAKCAVAAMRKGYKMFAVQHGGWCAASATADQTFDKYGGSAACGSDGEGGPWANQVYVIKEIDECSTGKHNCSHVAVCNNSIGSYNCICKEGYVGDGRNCSDIDECSTGEHNCTNVAVCKNTIGSYHCACQEGYVGDGRSCSDIDECSTGKHNCSHVAVCNNTIGSYNCTCKEEYVGDGRNCSDIDECSTGEHNCTNVAVCKNTIGSYHCACQEGYVGDGRSCSDIDECSTGKHNCSHVAVCNNTIGSYNCTCKEEYVGDGRNCSDIDECSTGKHNCSHVAVCNNTIGSYNCTCKEEYVGDGRNCSDIDECSTGKHNCSHVAVCNNTIGSYNCTCKEEYVGDGRNCSEIDECSTGKHNCSHVAVCNNSIGSYNCICKEGYVGDGRNCSDIDECSTGEHNCTNVAVCKNTIGSYHCACQEGYVGDGRSCSDIDECSTGKHNCSHVAVCNNTIGSYNCTCKEEYVGDGRNCSEIDECSTGKHNCSHVAVCNNSIGSYNCICKEGYVGDGRNCSDIDECSTGEHNCTNVAVCKNTIGSYHCACQEGYVGDGRSCSDIDECSTGKHNCSHVAVCNNTIGSYSCTCKEEYVGDGRNCSDIDECSTGKHNCSHVAVCNNTIGSYNCTCKEEYVGDGRNCSDCPKDWVANDKYCYILLADQPKKLEDARKTCQKILADIPIIKSEQENNFIARLMRQAGKKIVRLGMKRENGNLLWFDGISAEKTNSKRYNAWGTGRPRNKNCAHMIVSSAKWFDEYCEYPSFARAPFAFCQKSRL